MIYYNANDKQTINNFNNYNQIMVLTNWLYPILYY